METLDNFDTSKYRALLVARICTEQAGVSDDMKDPDKWVVTEFSREVDEITAFELRMVRGFSQKITLVNSHVTAEMTTMEPVNFDSMDRWQFQFKFDDGYTKIETPSGNFIMRTGNYKSRRKGSTYTFSGAAQGLAMREEPPQGPDAGSW